jgi:hypothetical protein
VKPTVLSTAALLAYSRHGSLLFGASALDGGDERTHRRLPSRDSERRIVTNEDSIWVASKPLFLPPVFDD